MAAPRIPRDFDDSVSGGVAVSADLAPERLWGRMGAEFWDGVYCPLFFDACRGVLADF